MKLVDTVYVVQCPICSLIAFMCRACHFFDLHMDIINNCTYLISCLSPTSCHDNYAGFS